MRLGGALDSFPYGKAAFLILALTAIAGGWLLFHPIPRAAAALRYWTFTHISYEANREAARRFADEPGGASVEMQLVHITAVTSRLRAAFWADLDVPDLVEVEISKAGSFFRGPVEEIGFRDLTPYLESSGVYDEMVQTRFAAYSDRGRIFGFPLDLHPVALAYREDLVRELGIDVENLKTWEDFIREGRRVTIPGERYMLQLTDPTAGHYEMLLFQRGGGYFDARGALIMDSGLALDTLLVYTRMIAGPGRIASDLGSGAVLTQSIENAYILFYPCPDWMSYVIQNDVATSKGKMKLLPLPAWEPGGRRTSTLGGTMIAITSHCNNPEQAWRLIEAFYLDKEKLAARFRKTNIIPPWTRAWEHPAYDEPHPYWSGQRIGRLFTELAPEVPPQYTSPYIEIAKNKMADVVAACAAYYRAHGESGFEDFARARLRQAADEVRVFMRRDAFESEE